MSQELLSSSPLLTGQGRQLTIEQRKAAEWDGSVLVSACPGSGKTTVLSHRLALAHQRLGPSKRVAVGTTFTVRAAEELSSRLVNLDPRTVWVGTTHAFAIEWILRPYAPYSDRTRFGFTIADEFVSQGIKQSLGKAAGVPGFLIRKMSTSRNRHGALTEKNPQLIGIVNKYHRTLESMKLIDFDECLYLAHEICHSNPSVAASLGSVISEICVDEFQDTSDLFYSILGHIGAASKDTAFFLVGDPDQAIYSSLGGSAKDLAVLQAELTRPKMEEIGLTGCFRSAQKVIDFYSNFGTAKSIKSSGTATTLAGRVVYHNSDITVDDLPAAIAAEITQALANGTQQDDICVLAPNWFLVNPMGRQLSILLPDVALQSERSSVLPPLRHTLWYHAARLFLTDPSPEVVERRRRFASRLISEFRNFTGLPIRHEFSDLRRLLRLQNSIRSRATDPILFLDESLSRFARHLGVDLGDQDVQDGLRNFLELSEKRFTEHSPAKKTSTADIKRLFARKRGVSLGTCHGSKGEEYDTVICFGLLRGYVPHWDDIFDTSVNESLSARRLLYVVASRAKRQLIMFSEKGRRTQKGKPLHPSGPLQGSSFSFDT